MPDVSAVLAFSAAAAVLTITPGLDTALVLRTAAVEGVARARWAAAGICTGCLVWGSATALGLTALLAVSRLAYQGLRIAGAFYLMYLGVQMWRRNGATRADGAVERERAGRSNATDAGPRWFVRGLLTNLLNPKVGIFYVTFLPQFVPSGGSVGGYSLLFTIIHVMEGMIWLTLLTMAIRPIRVWLERPAVRRGLDRTTGAVLIGSGLALAFERRR
jgi:threonine/homoserine/homoserine lactone efflux protein